MVQLTRGQSEALNMAEGSQVWLLPIPNSTTLAT
jgi:hypothetical protein